jgi:hypothetical protein
VCETPRQNSLGLSIYTLKKNEEKIGLFQWEVGGYKERGNEGEYGGVFCIMYENRRMKPVEIVLRKKEGREQ